MDCAPCGLLLHSRALVTHPMQRKIDMARVLLVALVALSGAAAAQAPAEPPAAPPPAPQTPAPAPAPAPREAAPSEEVTEEIDARVEAAKREMREEIRAQLATQAAARGWEEEWVEQTRRLELLEIDGYLRTRPDLFHRFDLGRAPDPSGFRLFPRPPTGENERTMAGVNMRLRLEPTINVSEEVRVKLQVDALDNLVFGSTPLYAGSRDPRYDFGVFNETQMPPEDGLNAWRSSVRVKRAYGEVSTPVGILRFGRMGSHWGLGMLHNDGNGLDSDYGNTVDRFQFVTEPFTGWYVAPMIDFDVEGPNSGVQNEQGQPYDLSNSDDAHSYVIAIARRDTPMQERAKLENGLSVLNYGVHFSYRTQRFDPVGWASPDTGPNDTSSFIPRRATLYIPDVWAKLERKDFRIEIEAAAVLGSIENAARTPGEVDTAGAVLVRQFGAVAQGEYRLMDGQLKLGLEGGYASGDRQPGFGNKPGRGGNLPGGFPGDNSIDGRQYADGAIRNFRFNRDYRVDAILFRELIGGITDTVYVKPTVTYTVATGFDIYGSVIGSGAVYVESTPSQRNRLLGVELNAGARYLTEDGFVAALQYAILFPQDGLANVGAQPEDLENAQAIRAIIGVRF